MKLILYQKVKKKYLRQCAHLLCKFLSPKCLAIRVAQIQEKHSSNGAFTETGLSVFSPPGLVKERKSGVY